MEDCRRASWGERAGVWFWPRRYLNRQLDIRALGARDWEEISVYMVMKAMGLDEIT